MNTTEYKQGYDAFPEHMLIGNESDSFRMGWYDARDGAVDGLAKPRQLAAWMITRAEVWNGKAEDSPDEAAQALYYRLAAWQYREAFLELTKLDDLPRDFFFETLDIDRKIV